MTHEEMARLITQRMKDVQIATAQEIAGPTILPAEISGVFAGATFGLGVTMMFESGYDEDQIVELVRHIVGKLSASPTARGAS